MSNQTPPSQATTSADESERPAPDGYASWNAYWTKEHGQSWRRHPEIDEERKHYLVERRTVVPDIERGIYPFKDISLDRADIEWLLATHESKGTAGPVWWNEERPKPDDERREGLDLRGANLQKANLSGLPLTRLIGGLDREHWNFATLEQRDAARLHLEQADLVRAHLEGAILGGAHMEGASIFRAHLERAALVSTHLEGALLRGGHLDGAHLRAAYFNAASNLAYVSLSNEEDGPVVINDVRWNNVNLTPIDWTKLQILGNELEAREPTTRAGNLKDYDTRLNEYGRAVRSYRQLAIMLRAQGVNEDADRFAYRAQLCQRVIFRRQRKYLRYASSLFLDGIAGYGYRPLRSLLTYVVTIAVFALLYWCVTNGVSLTHGMFTDVIMALHMSPPAPPAQHLQGYEAVVISMTSFHGRGFFSPAQTPGDKVAILAAVEAAIGLLIEITFIATFTQRFFAH